MKDRRSVRSAFLQCVNGTAGKRRLAAGYTLLELMIALAISAAILSSAVVAVYHVLVTSDRSVDQTIALADANRAALTIRNDLMMAMTTDLSSTPKSSANLTWFDYTSSFGTSFQTNHTAIYTLNGKELRRFYDSTTNFSIIGRNISAISFTQSGKAVTVAITSSNTTLPSRSKSIQFTVHLRPEEIH